MHTRWKCPWGENVHARWECPQEVTFQMIYELPSKILHSLIFFIFSRHNTTRVIWDEETKNSLERFKRFKWEISQHVDNNPLKKKTCNLDQFTQFTCTICIFEIFSLSHAHVSLAKRMMLSNSGCHWNPRHWSDSSPKNAAEVEELFISSAACYLQKKSEFRTKKMDTIKLQPIKWPFKNVMLTWFGVLFEKSYSSSWQIVKLHFSHHTPFIAKSLLWFPAELYHKNSISRVVCVFFRAD